MKFLKTTLNYLIAFLIVGWGLNQIDPNFQSQINSYLNPITTQPHHPNSNQQPTKPSSQASNNTLPDLNQNQTKNATEHWASRQLTVDIQTTDPQARQDFRQAIAAWNKANIIKLKLIKDPQTANIICDIQDLSANTQQSNLITSKQLGDTEVSYDPTTGEINHAKSVIDIGQIQSMPHNQQVWIAEHELGHALGLQHTAPGSHTVMEPENLTTGITATDINNLKKIYP